MSSTLHSSPNELFTELLTRARLGESAAMGRLLEFQRAHLLSLARKRIPRSLQRRMAPSDAVQVTLMSAYRHFAQFRGESSEEFSDWLRTILLNSIRDLVRAVEGRRKTHVIREVSLDAFAEAQEAAPRRGGGPSVCDRLIDQETRTALHHCIEQLPDSYRRVLQMRFDDQLCFERIGAALGITPQAALKLRRRALQAVADSMQMCGIVE